MIFSKIKKIIFIISFIVLFICNFAYAESSKKVIINKVESVKNDCLKISMKFNFKDSFERVIPDLKINDIEIKENDKKIDNSNIFLNKLPPKKQKISVYYVIDNSKNLTSEKSRIKEWIEKINTYLYEKDSKIYFTLDSNEPKKNIDINKIYFDKIDINKKDSFNTLIYSINSLSKDNESKRVLFFFSEGFDRTNQNIDEIISKANGYNISIYPVNFLLPSGTLDRISQTTDGFLLPGNNNEKKVLESLFKKISKEMSEEYKLVFHSPTDNSKSERKLNITLNYNNQKLFAEKNYSISNSCGGLNWVFIIYSFFLIIILFLIIYFAKKLRS